MKNNKRRLYRVLIVVFLVAAPFGALFAQAVTVTDLMPLAFGQYVQYNQYDTTTSGAAPTKSNAYYEVIQNGLSFQTHTGVSVVRDVLGSGNPTGTHELHYSFTSAGDLQVFADTALLADILPSSLAPGVSPTPNIWIDYFKLSAGVNNSYPIMVVNTTGTSGGNTANVTITFTGKYVGIEKVTVPKGTSDSAYRFDIAALVNISAAGGFVHGSFTVTQSNWLVRGIGIVKTNAPISGTTIAGNPTTTIGTEKEMTSFGIAGSGVAQSPAPNSNIRIYPDPASDQTTLTFDRPADRIFLYNNAGEMIRSFELSSHVGEALIWVGDIPNGAYHARVMFADGSSKTAEMVIRH